MTSGVTSSNDGESHFGGGNSYYYQQTIVELREHIRHLETVNSKLLPDLERYEAEIYELRA